MATHLGAIGFHSDSQEEFFEFMGAVLKETTGHECSAGLYLQWSSDGGAEFWSHISKSNDLVGGTPFFRGKSEYVASLQELVRRPDDNLFEGAILGWAVPGTEDDRPGMFPFVFDMLDPLLYGKLDLPFESPVKLSAFADNISIYASDDEFVGSQEGEAKLSPESFFPTGLMSNDPNESGPPASFAVINGHILEFKELENPISSQTYFWFHVSTAGGTIDVVSEKSLINTTPCVGGVVSGGFWLCGQIMAPQAKREGGFWERFKLR